jgi:hypothetical protein
MSSKIGGISHILGLAEHFSATKIILLVLSMYDVYYIFNMFRYVEYLNMYDYILCLFIFSINLFIFFVFMRIRDEYRKEKTRAKYY